MLATELSEIVGVDNVTIVAMHYPYKPCRYRWNGIDVIGIGANNAKFPMRLKYWRHLKKILNRLHAEKGSIRIHSFWFSELSYLADKWAQKNNMQHSVTLMGQEVKKGNRYISRTPISENKIISLSQFQSDALIKNYGITPGSIIPFGIDDEPKNEVIKRYDIIGVGSLVKVKNYDKFLQVIVEVKKAIPNINVCIVGGGYLLETIKTKAIEFGLNDNIEFTGLLSRDQSILKMSESKLMLHTSLFEGGCFVLCEAMSQEIDIVSTPVGIAPNIPEIKTADSARDLAHLVISSLQDKSQVKYTKLPSVNEVTLKYIDFWNNTKNT
jgi:glycosyltransferase involved in cell wall biosynthesis